MAYSVGPRLKEMSAMQTAAAPPVVDPADVEAFRRDGFVHLKGLIDAKAVDAYRAAVDAAVTARKRNDTRSLAEKSPYEQSFIQCQYLWEDFPPVRPLTFHPKVVGAAAALIGAERMRIWHDQALYKEVGGRETDAHQDHPYWPIAELKTLTAWIPLVEVDDTAGCMGYVPGSHDSKAEYVNIFSEPGSGEKLLAKQKAAPVYKPARPGDVLFHHGLTVHLAKPNRSDRTRKAYTVIYFADGCTRSANGGHTSVDRDQIAVGAVIDGRATPIAWPLPDEQYPEPAPWPDFAGNRLLERAAEMGVMPSKPVA
jgi:ectoine hydroxylase-related dioxygenase (phytanoyl-CoA dioxygenase family)